MATQGRLYLILAILVATLLIRMHGAAAASGDLTRAFLDLTGVQA